ncbi:hypothetical protein ElyMa_000655900 [Elysia marginata]|uniref:Ras-GEF domain-containing protein n=1 Tax=Elysia marginata TaxID=1093978 RepID=A0AAV4GGH5_9GAST|nr:hypothetical protein ElyMa_000655900 [Elysia marginata]
MRLGLMNFAKIPLCDLFSEWTKISNHSLYKKCEEVLLSLHVLESRWRLFGHILRRDPCNPANEAMQFYFVENNKRLRGKPITTLPVTLNNDLKHVPGEKITLTSQNDLDLIRDIAENRDEWRTFIVRIRRGAAEAVRSDDPASELL